jgi:hypothetical protein
MSEDELDEDLKLAIAMSLEVQSCPTGAPEGRFGFAQKIRIQPPLWVHYLEVRSDCG